MKKTIKLAVVAALALGATSAFATNGSALIGMGAKARGMAGTGIGMSHGAESALVNPALITSVKNTEVSFGGTLFMPNVTFDNGMGSGAYDSAADMNVIPEVSVASKVSDNLYVGVGIWGTAGMGTDYRDYQSNFKMVTNLQLMQFGVPVAYKAGNFSVAVTPVLQYGALDINFDTNGSNNVGAGIAQDLKFGYNLGASFETNGLTVGAVYKSRIDMEYKGQLSAAMAGFGQTYTNDKLSTPAEMGIGASYVMGEHTIAIDYKKIKWSDAKGYKDFKWDDQNVIAVGYQYTTNAWALRAGYNYAKSPISDQGLTGTLTNTLNLLGFPAIVESHYAVGATYNVSNTTSFDLGLTYAPEVTNTYTVSNYPAAGTRSITTTHSQTGVSAQVNFAF
jgi:long-chain fatty acid transport protein